MRYLPCADLIHNSQPLKTTKHFKITRICRIKCFFISQRMIRLVIFLNYAKFTVINVIISTRTIHAAICCRYPRLLLDFYFNAYLCLPSSDSYIIILVFFIFLWYILLHVTAKKKGCSMIVIWINVPFLLDSFSIFVYFLCS